MSKALARNGGRTVTGLVAAILAAPLLAFAPAAHAAKGMEIAIQDDGLFVSGSTQFDKPAAYRLLNGIQTTRIRFNATWLGLNVERKSTTKPATPTYNFTQLDQAITSARFNGLKVLLSVSGPGPAWANGKKTDDVKKGADYKPNVKEFGKFAKIVAQRYKGQVDQYSVWNEPNRKGWLQPLRTSGSTYRKLYIAGYKAIKSVNKKSKVFMGELAPFVRASSQGLQPLAFLRQMMCVNRSYRRLSKRCSLLRADGFAMHAYDFDRPPTRRYPNRDAVTIANLGSLTSALDRFKRAGRLKPNKGSRMNLYLTEYGYFASKVPRTSSKKPGPKVFKEKTRAKYYVDAFKIAQKNKRVKSMLQFLLVAYGNAGTTAANFNFDTSIVKGDGTKTRSYIALAAWAKKAAARKLIKPAPTP